MYTCLVCNSTIKAKHRCTFQDFSQGSTDYSSEIYIECTQCSWCEQITIDDRSYCSTYDYYFKTTVMPILKKRLDWFQTNKNTYSSLEELYKNNPHNNLSLLFTNKTSIHHYN